MEIIDELEVTRRGPYSGGFGSISFNGDMDIALALRTMVFPTGTRYDTMYSYKDATKRQEWVAYLQAGAGIVADSIPDDEQQECQNKAAGLARAIDLAESAFVNTSWRLMQCTDTYTMFGTWKSIKKMNVMDKIENEALCHFFDKK